ncbi:BON domain-containing protein [Azospirillum oleiclasticum]|nr:BON domain-containing protein [Azospirillum oleiclasticum]
MTPNGDHRGPGPRGHVRSDARVLDDLHDRLTEDPRLDAAGITVQGTGGDVALTGTVAERDAGRIAEHIARSVSGVDHVRNDLRVRRPDPDDRSAYAAATPVSIPGLDGRPGHRASVRPTSGAVTDTGAPTGQTAKRGP